MATATAIEYGPAGDAPPTRARSARDGLALVTPSWDDRTRVAPLVPRPRLVHALGDAAAPPVALLVAPAGYGKTTLLREWSRRDERPFAWVALDERDNDPRRLRASARRAVAEAVGRAGPVTPFVLVLDDVQELHERGAIAALAMIARDLPPHARLAIASRTQPELPIARLRAQRGVIEVGPRELAMTRAEAAALMRADQHDVDAQSIDTLVARTEGWPVALSLASLFLADRGVAAVGRFGGADRLMRQYVRDEMLAGLPADRLDFMLRTSVADVLTVPLCDTLAGRGGSASTLAGLARDGLVVPLDRCDERFRYHRLLAEYLHAELRISTPEREPELHRAASAWHRGEGDVERAIDHALRAGEVAEAGTLVWQNLPSLVAEGRTSTAERWLARFGQRDIAEHATLALTAAGCALLRGQGDVAAHWTAAATAANGHDPTLRAAAVILRSALAGAATGAARDPAEDPGDGAGGALCALVEGMARRHEDDPDGAVRAFEAGARYAAVCAPALHALCLAELAVVALDEGDWESAAALVTRARAQVDRHGLADHAAMALVFAASALVRAHRGRVDSAQSDLLEAERLQSQFTDFSRAAEAEVNLLLARAALRLGDVTLGRRQLTGALRLLRRLPDAVALHRWAAEVRARLDAFTTTTEDSSAHPSMTAAELRILQYLPTHLSFREIGELTYVSANTVKTQANAIYRKLCVSSRSEAVARARDCGLLDGA